jgi:hypothetical protein
MFVCAVCYRSLPVQWHAEYIVRLQTLDDWDADEDTVCDTCNPLSLIGAYDTLSIRMYGDTCGEEYHG